MSGHGGWGGRWRGPGWRGAGWRGPGPPPWWPQGEAWPPAGRPTWPRMGHRFMWRVGWFMAAPLFLMGGGLALGVGLVGAAGGVVGAGPPGGVLAVPALVVVFRPGPRARPPVRP